MSGEVQKILERAKLYLRNAKHINPWKQPLQQYFEMQNGPQKIEFLRLALLRWRFFLLLPNRVKEFEAAIVDDDWVRILELLAERKRRPRPLREAAVTTCRLVRNRSIVSPDVFFSHSLEIVGRITVGMSGFGPPMRKNWPFFTCELYEFWCAIGSILDKRDDSIPHALEVGEFYRARFG